MKFAVFWDYAKSLTIFSFSLILLFSIIGEGSSVASGIWLAKWSSTTVTSDSERDKFLGVYGGLGMSQAVFVLCASVAMALGSRVASRQLHQRMMVNIMHSPMSFFETTPQGRIMNRFSKDISGIDDVIPSTFMAALRISLQVFGAIFAITYATPVFLAVIVPLAVVYVFVQVRFYSITLTWYNCKPTPRFSLIPSPSLRTFMSKDEDDYEYRFSVLNMSIRFGVRHLSKCACSERKTQLDD